jgi:tetratricopeptide (TPR) repeat protein
MDGAFVKRLTIAILLSATSLLASSELAFAGSRLNDYRPATIESGKVELAVTLDGCLDVPELHHSIAAEITECTSLIHAAGQLPEMRAGAFYHRGLLYQLEGKYDLAIADYTSAIGWQHDFLDAYEARGDAYANFGQPGSAKADYEVTGTSRGDDAERCWVRAVRGYPLDRALADCNAALKDYPDSSSILQSRCFVYYRMRNFAAALTDCQAAEKSHLRYDEALYVGGLAKLGLGDTKGGYADIAAARDANYQIADIYALYGVKQ